MSASRNDAILDFNERLREEAERRRVANGGDPPDNPGVNERIAKIEGQVDTLKVVRPMTIAVFSVLLASLIFVLGYMNFQIMATNAKVDAIPGILRDEFRAMRAETAAQTSAIANSVTSARSTPVQVIMVPAPQEKTPNQMPER